MLEAMFIAYFTAELLVRFVAAPRRKAFCKDFLNVVDFVAVCQLRLGLPCVDTLAACLGHRQTLFG